VKEEKKHRKVGVKVPKRLSEHRWCIFETFFCLSDVNLLVEKQHLYRKSFSEL